MFTGFTDETVDFMWGIRFNNEKPWFEAHKDIYLNHFYQPMRELGEELLFVGSSLCQIPMIWQMIGHSGVIGVITGHSGLLRESS